MTNFEDTKVVFVKNFIDAQGIKTISTYMEYALNQKIMVRGKDNVTTSYYRYGDPLIETVLANALPDVEEITGRSLHPTYSFARVYIKGDALTPHVDRPACEYSVTVNVATVGEPWPIWVEVPGKESVSFTLEPGDALVYKGCEVKHWREEATGTKINAQFMLHYVDQAGPHASFKWDKRPSLGASETLRRI